MPKKYKSFIFYTATISIFIIIMYGIVHLAKVNLEHPDQIVNANTDLSAWGTFLHNFIIGLKQPIPMLILQLAIILITVRIFGWICQKIGQPTVVGEIIAGIVLGPSLLGLYFPNTSAFLFPASSLGNIEILSQIGLILFMFIVGLELNLKEIKRKANEAVIISHASIIFPFALGFVLAYLMYEKFALNETPFMSFALFMGISMSITAFPVLARIVHERGINKTAIGPIVITCAAIDDITAWCVLAAVIAIVKAGSFTSSLFVIVIALAYVLIMFKIVKPALKKVTDPLSSKKMMSKAMIIVYFVVLFLSAYATELIGIHALFGAFMAGVIMPTNLNFRENITKKIEDVALILFLPLFFAFTGLRTEIGLLNSLELWLICGGVTLVAIIGKFFGSALSARYIGLNWKDSSIIGILMNTRGLMELVVLNIGHDLGILSSQVFAMLVVMALVTTFMTSPLMELTDKLFKKNKSTDLAIEHKFNILVSFEETIMGKKLLYLAHALMAKNENKGSLTLLHVTEGNPLYQYDVDKQEEEIFKPIIDEAKCLELDVNQLFKISDNRARTTIKYANTEEINLILTGVNHFNYSDTLLGKSMKFLNKTLHIPVHFLSKVGKNKNMFQSMSAPFDESTRTIISKSDMDVAIFIDNNMLMDIRNIFIAILDEDDFFLGPYLRKISQNLNAQFIVWDKINLASDSLALMQELTAIKTANPYHYQQWSNNILVDINLLKKQDLMIISLNSWKKLLNQFQYLEKEMPSVLVIAN